MARSIFVASLVSGAIALAALGCGGSDETRPSGGGGHGATGGGGGGGGEGGGLACTASGVSKGPWALAVDGTSAMIRWEACAPGTAPGLSFAPEAGGASANADAVETPFEVTETYVAPLNPSAPPDLAGTYYMHEAKLDGLSPGTCYAYSLDADAAAKGRFCTARAPGEPFRFMAIGDTNPALGDATKNVLAHALPMDPDFVLHGGDIEYYDSGLETWAYWFGAMQPMLSQGAFYPAIGNHESEKPVEFEQYTERFFGDAGFDGTPSYYRFESGGVWFFALDTQQPAALASTQGAWFQKQLADAASQPGYRFSVVYFHRPIVTCGDTGDDPALFEQYAPLFQQYGVPLVLQAHMHGYERFLIDGITYVTSAGGGGLLGDVDENVSRPYCSSRVASGAYKHALLVDVSPSGLAGQAVGEDGAVLDQFTIAVP